MKTVCIIVCLLPTLVWSETFRQNYRKNGDRARALNFIDQPAQDADTINMILRGDKTRGNQKGEQENSKSAEQNEVTTKKNRRMNKQLTDSAEQIRDKQVNLWALVNRQKQQQDSSEIQQPDLEKLHSEQQQIKKQWSVYHQQQQQGSSSSQQNSASQEWSTKNHKSQEKSSSQENSNESNRRQDSSQQDSSSGQQEDQSNKSSRKSTSNKNQQGSSSQEDSVSQQQISSEQQDSQQVITQNENRSNDNSDSSSLQQDSTEQRKVASPRQLNLKTKKRSTTLDRNTISQEDVSQDSSFEKQQRSSFRQQSKFGRKQGSSNLDSSSEEKMQRLKPNSNENASTQELNSIEISREMNKKQKKSSQQNSVSKKQRSTQKIESSQQQSSEQSSSEQDASKQNYSSFRQKNSQQKVLRQKGTSSQQDSSQQNSSEEKLNMNPTRKQESSENSSTQNNSSFRQKNSQQKVLRQKGTSSQQDSSQQNSSEEKLNMKPTRKQESSENSSDYSKEHSKKTKQGNQNGRSHHHHHDNNKRRPNEYNSQYKNQRQSNEQESSEENTNVYERYNQKQKANDKRKIKQWSPKSQDQSSEEQDDHIPMKKFNMKAGKKARLQMEEISNINTEAYKNMPQVTEEQKTKLLNELKVAEKETKGDKNLNATGMLMKNGYAAENHEVTTKDGYILSMVRIPAQSEGAPVVFLMHGLLGSADDWLLMGPHKSLAYMLSEAGYDVWLGNARGSKYSRKHVTKQPAMSSFWEYGIDEIAQQDLPVMIDYVLEKTQQQQLNYVGHSLGATAFFAMAATNPQYNEKIIKMFAISPMVYMSNVRSPVIQMMAPNKPLEAMKDGEFRPSKEWIDVAGGSELKEVVGSKAVASNVYFITAGINMEHMNVSSVPVIMAHLPAGGSNRQLKQLGQEVASGEFTQFDYGSVMNEQVYGNPVPPKYRLENVMAPVALYYSDADWLAHPVDVDRLKTELPNVIEDYKVPVTRFASTDFLFGTSARDVINRKLIESMNM